MIPDALGRDRRGQTVQDFAVGASVFLLTVAFTFAFVPSIFTPFDSEVVAGAGPQADRVATSLTQDLSVDERSNRLDGTDTVKFFTNSSLSSSEDLQDEFGLPLASTVNITIRPIDDGPPVTTGSDTLATGREFRNRPAASVTRIVAIPGIDECDPGEGNACRLTVRVW